MDDISSRDRWDDSFDQDPAGDWNPRGPGPSDAAAPRPLEGSDSGLADVSLRFSAREASASGPRPQSTGEAEPSARPGVVRFPRPGKVLGGFRLVGELGQGAFARVYLAEQADLAGRLVALKVSKAIGDEPYSLARLQHAHIVPIHSVHDDPETGLRLLCMPYLGGADLARILDLSETRVPSAATGRSFLDALDRLDARRVSAISPSRRETVRPSLHEVRDEQPRAEGRSLSEVRAIWWGRLLRWSRVPGLALGPEPRFPAEPDLAASQPARRYYQHHTYIQASVWIIARLAEALQHAHDRGLLHRDLKPSNVLIAADGSPMLLDFNLSADLDPDGPEQALLGGTLPYMAPEHLDAFNPEGLTPACSVDERSDLYALGLILFEMVTGEHPFPDPPRSDEPMPEVLRRMVQDRRKVPSARSVNPEVPHGLDSVLKKCLDSERLFRYGRAEELADDLQRLLDDRPLKHAPEPSLTEQAAKWLRRHPEARSSTTIGLLSTVLIVVVAGIAWLAADQYQAAAEGYRRQQFASAFQECQVLLNTSSGPRSHWQWGLDLADRELRAFGLFSFDPKAAGASKWEPPMPHLLESERQSLAEELAELVLLKVRSEEALSRGQPEPKRRLVLKQALPWLDRAEAIDPHPPAALYQERARIKAALGRGRDAARDRIAAAKLPPRTARDYYLLGTDCASEGDLERAEALLGRAVALDSREFWAWFALGLCHYDQARFAEAATDFAACTILAPKFAWPHLNRGLALARLGRLTEAATAYDQAVEANPDFLQARVNRALCALERNDPARAEKDLDRAIRLGARDPAVLAAHAEALARLGRSEEADRQFGQALERSATDLGIRVAFGFFLLSRDPEAAREQFERVLAVDPDHPRALLGLARLVRVKSPEMALGYLDQALGQAPDLLDAVQLRALTRARQGLLSALDDIDQLSQTPTPHNLYNAACSLALLADRTDDPRLEDRALNLLKRALDAGFPASEATRDPDFEALRHRSEFHRLVEDEDNR